MVILDVRSLNSSKRRLIRRMSVRVRGAEVKGLEVPHQRRLWIVLYRLRLVHAGGDPLPDLVLRKRGMQNRVGQKIDGGGEIFRQEFGGQRGHRIQRMVRVRVQCSAQRIERFGKLNRGVSVRPAPQ